MKINWFPGHMKRTKEEIKKSVNLVDLIYEVIDARIPNSSQNPAVEDLIKNKPKLVILNKSDLSDSYENKQWIKYFNERNIPAVLVNSIDGLGINEVIKFSYKLTEDNRKLLKEKGVKARPIRAMIIGIPNVGKSALINSLSGRKSARTGNKPGITKGKQWIRIRKDLELLDTPGILWRELEDENIGLNLAFTGAIKDEILDIETLAFNFIDIIKEIYPENLEKRYNIGVERKSTHDIILEVAKKRGCMQKGGIVDYTKVGNIILDDFRKGRLGKITLEFPHGRN